FAFIPAGNQGVGSMNDERRIHFGGGSGQAARQYYETFSALAGLNLGVNNTTTNLEMSGPWIFRVGYWSNGAWQICGNSQSADGYAEPGYAVVAVDTNGNSVFRFYDYFDPHSS